MPPKVKKRGKPGPKPSKDPQKPSKYHDYEGWKAGQAAISRERSQTGREIGPLPEVMDPERRESCRWSHEKFALTYFPNRFFWPFAPYHTISNARMERCTHEGGRFAMAEPRGSGKTSRAEVEILRGILYGHRRFYVLLQATEPLASRSLRKIQRELETNDLLAADFPEVCYPIRRLERIHNRANGQTLNDKPTRIEWSAHGITLPTVDGSPSSGSIIWVGGITGAVRGLSANGPGGEVMRPDAVLIDDAQTRESSRSLSQTAEREAIIDGDILGLAGPDTQIAAMMLCTVITPGDLSDRYLNQEKKPDWQGVRVKMLESFPQKLDLWDQYIEARRQSVRAGNGGKESDEFYAANREAMDEGARVSWPERVKTGEVSAVQSAMHLYYQSPSVFQAEYQNDPDPIDIGALDELDAEAITRKVNGCSRGEVPPDVTRLTAFVDVGNRVLFWCVCGWTEGFSGHVIDYGAYPKQNRSYFAATDARPCLADLFSAHNEDARIFAGLKEAVSVVVGRGYRRQGSEDELRVERCLVDSGKWTKTVAMFCRQSQYRDVLTASKGWGIGSGRLPMASWTLKPGERRGDYWVMRPNTEGGHGKLVTFDANYFKSFVAKALATPPAGAGCLQLFGDNPDAHRLFAEHLTAEYRSGKHVTTGDLGGQDLWSQRPDRRDNHWWDTLVGCAAAASIAGVKFSVARAVGEEPVAPPARKTVRLSQLPRRTVGGARS